MLLFVSDLAFEDEALLHVAKVGILAASVVSGLGGWLLLRGGSPEARVGRDKWESATGGPHTTSGSSAN